MMIRLFISLCLSLVTVLPMAAQGRTTDQIPNVQHLDRNRYTSNPDGVLSAACVASLDSLCGGLRTEGIAQIAVVAVKDIADADSFDFSQKLFSAWGVGSDKNSNGLGVLLILDRHEIRFHTGRGTEGTLTDALCNRIQQQYMLPYFRRDDYDGGMLAGMRAVAGVLRNDAATLTALEDEDDSTDIFIFLGIVLATIFGLFFFSIAASRRAKRCPHCKKNNALKLSKRIVLESTDDYDFVEEVYVCTSCGAELRRRKHIYKDNSHGGSGGGPIIFGGMGGRGMGGGSVGGGFGGGSFGGGGSSSHW